MRLSLLLFLAAILSFSACKNSRNADSRKQDMVLLEQKPVSGQPTGAKTSSGNVLQEWVPPTAPQVKMLLQESK